MINKILQFNGFGYNSANEFTFMIRLDNCNYTEYYADGRIVIRSEDDSPESNYNIIYNKEEQ